MMQYFDFSRLITKYKSDFTSIVLAEGHYDESGDWVKDTSYKIPLEGAIISFKESKVYHSNGTLTTNDKRLFTLKPIDEKLQGLKVIHENKIYSVEDCTENAKFTGVYAYTLRYISAFKDATPNFDITIDIEDLEKRLDGVSLSSDMPVQPSEEEIKIGQIKNFEKRLDGTL